MFLQKTTVQVLVAIVSIGAVYQDRACEVKARTTAGWVCGIRRHDINGAPYASFQNVPYAKQPVGQLRFKELQPPEPWKDLYDATKEGPICPQYDLLYGRLLTNRNMSEACIHANIYIPIYALPINEHVIKKGLSIFVFIHGGGFASGSGDPDLHGPEYLVTKDIIIFTFNYRLGAFGYLSLNSPSIPGNNGLRDCLTFLRWVKANAKYFGGNSDDITIGGQSSGGVNAHLLVLSNAAKGLFKRAILMSGVATRSFYTTPPKYAKQIANQFISELGINDTDPEAIHRQLISTPLDKIINATGQVQIKNSRRSFCPVVEQRFARITTVLDKDPETLLLNGQGKNIPLMVGFTNKEAELYIPIYIQFDILGAVNKNPLLMLSPDLIYRLSNETAQSYAKKTKDRYFSEAPTPQKYASCYGDYAYIYPAINLVRAKAATGGAPVFLYQFSYNTDFSAIKETKHIEYNGAAHLEDLTFIFQTNSLKGIQKFDHPTHKDTKMREYMVQIIKNFIKCSDPVCGKGQKWPAQKGGTPVKYENINNPDNIIYRGLTEYQRDMVGYLDALYNTTE